MSGSRDYAKPPARSDPRAVTGALGSLALLALGGLLLYRAGARRRPAAPRPAPRGCGDLVEESINLLGAIRGYCELAKLKGENGYALESRMDRSIATVDEAAVLLRRVLGACRGRAP